MGAHIEAHAWRTEASEDVGALTHRNFSADLAALVDAVAAKDRAIEDLIEYGMSDRRRPLSGW